MALLDNLCISALIKKDTAILCELEQQQQNNKRDRKYKNELNI